MNNYELGWKRDYRTKMLFLYLQVIFLSLGLGCMIAIAWIPANWIQLAVTAVLLLLAGATCRHGRT